MKRSPKISVIIPVYNAEKFLKRCVESVINQTYQNYELILINDGSTDNSTSLCNEFAEHNPKIRVFHQENTGPSAARNKGIDETQGKYITFIDADDYVEPDYLEAFISFDLNINNDLVIQGHKMENSNGNIKERKFQRKVYSKSLYSELFYSAHLVRRHPYACIEQLIVYI